MDINYIVCYLINMGARKVSLKVRGQRFRLCDLMETEKYVGVAREIFLFLSFPLMILKMMEE